MTPSEHAPALAHAVVDQKYGRELFGEIDHPPV
jgi:hypothetical protein